MYSRTASISPGLKCLRDVPELGSPCRTRQLSEMQRPEDGNWGAYNRKERNQEGAPAGPCALGVVGTFDPAPTSKSEGGVLCPDACSKPASPGPVPTGSSSLSFCPLHTCPSHRW